MTNFTRKMGAWAAAIFGAAGAGMLLLAAGRRQTSAQWANDVGVDLDTWLRLAGVLLVGGLALMAICRWPTRK